MLLGLHDSAHYNLNYPCSQSSFTGCCHDCGPSTFTTLNTSPWKEVRNTAGGKLWPILIPLFGRRNKSVCGIINALWHASSIDAGTDVFAFKRCKALLWARSVFTCLVTDDIARSPTAIHNFKFNFSSKLISLQTRLVRKTQISITLLSRALATVLSMCKKWYSIKGN